jgi:hypothetical protein
MSGADRTIRWSTAAAVIGVAAVAAVVPHDRLTPGACARGDGVDGPAHPADGGWPDLVEFDGDARLGAAGHEGAGARSAGPQRLRSRKADLRTAQNRGRWRPKVVSGRFL